MGTLPTEYGQAIRSIRAAKNVFWWLMAVAIVIQLVIFFLVAWGGVLDPASETPAVATKPAETAETPAAEATEAEAADEDGSEWWHAACEWALPATQFSAMVLAGLLTLTLMLAVKVSLVGRLGGVASLLGAFFWSLLLLAVLIPWQHALPYSPHWFSGALFDYNDLVGFTGAVKASWGATNVGTVTVVLYYLRFLAYPILAVLIWLLVDLKFRHGCRGIVVSAAEPPSMA